jgi:drug/metabolite transporter (DMT)-like permease
MKPFLWFGLFLGVGGVIFYGWAKIVLLTLLIACGLFFGSAAVYAVVDAIKHRIPKPTNPQNQSADEYRQVKAQELARELVQASALATVKPADPELRHLRRMAGLE